MKTKDEFSREHLLYLKRRRNDKIFVNCARVALIIIFLALWELFYRLGAIDGFIFSAPSKIFKSLVNLTKTGELFKHAGITLFETVAGFAIATSIGTLVALALWWNDRLRRILDPYVVVLNSLPKIALGPVIIIWFGSGTKSIVVMTILITVIVTTITMLSGFTATDKNKIFLLKSLGAKKPQILTKLVIPSSLPTFISMLKINIGLSWIGSIMGEYLVSRAGLGYLIVYGGQVFKLDLVYAATLTLCLLATGMYALVSLIEKITVGKKQTS
ncbi:MAG: ABC transporter permease [Clostridia bacterium]|nr:ABC transporter permease [Clostridia bacterium]MBQ9482047.1 ABC transporter permease [Clostridia bacterium]